MPRSSRLFRFLPLLAGLLAGALLLAAETPLLVLRNALFDQYQRWSPRPVTEQPVRIVDIDEESLVRLGQWPWPRTRLAELSARLTAAGVAAITFDVIFAEADRTSPAALARQWPVNDEQRRQLLALPDHDAVFAGQLAASPAVLGFALTSAPGPRQPATRAAIVNLGEDQRAWVPAFSGAVPSLPQFEALAPGNGALSFVPDRDGVVRRVPLVLRLGERILPTLVSESLRVAQAAPAIILRSAGHQQQLTGHRDRGGLGEIRIGALTIPTTPQGELWLHYSERPAAPALPAWRVLADAAESAALAGHIVLVGSSAQGLLDLRFTPFGLRPGVAIHAEALAQILAGDFLERPGWSRAAELLLAAATSLLAGFLALRWRALAAAGLALTLVLAGALASWLAFARAGLLLDPLPAQAATLFAFIVCSLAHHFVSEREQRRIRGAFARYVSPNRVTHLLANEADLALGGERRDCSFIFTDLAGFTGLMEGIDPGRAVALLNDYLDGMIAIAFRHEGTLDRIVGDAVAIMFSAPLAQPDHAARAFACTLEMDAFACAYAQRQRQAGIAFGDTRIGVHRGEVIVGNFGGKTIFDYRALGDPVNTAARLESANKHLGTRVCVSQAILDDLPPQAVRPVGRVLFKGKTQPLAIFEALTPADAGRRAPVEVYATAWQSLSDDADLAIERFAELHAAWPEDGLVAMHWRRLQAGERGDLIVLSAK